MKNYSCSQVDNLISRYIDAGGNAIQTNDGVLGCGNWILFDFSNNLKCFVITEIYLNEWSSTHTIKSYNKIPKKYLAQIEKFENEN